MKDQIFTYEIEWFEGSKYWIINRRRQDGLREMVATENKKADAIALAERLNLQAAMVEKEVVSFLADELFRPLVERLKSEQLKGCRKTSGVIS